MMTAVPVPSAAAPLSCTPISMGMPAAPAAGQAMAPTLPPMGGSVQMSAMPFVGGSIQMGVAPQPMPQAIEAQLMPQPLG